MGHCLKHKTLWVNKHNAKHLVVIIFFFLVKKKKGTSFYNSAICLISSQGSYI